MARRNRRASTRRRAVGRARTSGVPAKRRRKAAVGRGRSTRRRTARRRSKSVRGANVGFAKFLTRDLQGVVMNGAVAAVSATASPYLVAEMVNRFAKDTEALQAGTTGRRLATIATGILSAFAILKLTKKLDIAVAWATGPVVTEGSALLSGLIPIPQPKAPAVVTDPITIDGYMGALMPEGQIPSAVSEQFQNVAGMMPGGQRPELGVRAA